MNEVYIYVFYIVINPQTFVKKTMFLIIFLV